MVDFVRETVIDVQEATIRFKVNADTIRRWFRQGLEKRKVGGKVFTSLEAFQRFSRDDQLSRETQQGSSLSPEAEAAIRELRERFGIDISNLHGWPSHEPSESRLSPRANACVARKTKSSPAGIAGPA